MRMIGATSARSGGELGVLGRDPDREAPLGRGWASWLRTSTSTSSSPWPTTSSSTPAISASAARGRDGASPSSWSSSAFRRTSDKVERLSGGMQRRLPIARSLINEPELLLLDEPTTGLDPQARHALWDRLCEPQRQGGTLVLTTDYMDEAEQLCDRLVIMDKGVIVADGSPRQLIETHVSREVVELRVAPGQAPAMAAAVEGMADRLETLAGRTLALYRRR